MTKFGLAQSVRRVEDPRLLNGGGRYTDDIVLPDMLHGIVLRSPHAAAKLGAIDTTAAASVAGVKAIYTAADLNADGIAPMPCAAPVQNRDGSDMASPPHPALADGAVRHVGDPVAFIVADTPKAARDAAELISVDYTVEPAVTDVVAATGPGVPLVWPDVTNNVAFDWGIGDQAATDALFATAAHVTRLTVVNNRVIVASMEGRAAIADYDATSGRWTLYANTQGGWLIKNLIGNGVQHRSGEFPRHHARRRRRLRHEGVPLRRARADLLCRTQARTAGEVDIGPWRSIPGRHAGPRQRHAWRTGDRRRRKIPGAAHAQSRQHGRVSFDLRALYPDTGRGRRAVRRLRLPADLRQRTRRVHPHRAGGCLSWRWSSRKQLSAGASGRCRRARTRHRPRRTAPAQHGAGVGDAARDAGRQDLRYRRFSDGAGCGAEGDGLCRLRGPARGVRAARQASRHRPRLLSRSHHGRSDRAGGNPLRRGWLCRCLCRHAIDRPGPRDRAMSSSRRSGLASTARRSASARATPTPSQSAAAPAARAACIPKARRSCSPRIP